MRKLMFVFALFCSCNAQSQRIYFPEQDSNDKWFCGFGVNYIHSPQKDLEETMPTTVGFDLSIAGLYITWYFKYQEVKENQYGAGYELSKMHPIQTLGIGYGITTFHKNSFAAYIYPYFDVNFIQDIMEDAYYGENKIVNRYRYGGVGSGLYFKSNHIGLFLKFGSQEIGASLTYHF